MRVPSILTAVGAALMLSAAPVLAQVSCEFGGGGGPSCTVSHTVRSTVDGAAKLTLSQVFTDLGFIGIAAFEAGQKVSPGPEISIVANTTWELTVSSQGPTWGATTKDASDLRIAYNGGSPIALSTTAQSLASGSAGQQPFANTEFTSLWDWQADAPGSYQININFTLTAP